MMKVLGIGNALVDILLRLDDDRWLHEFSLPKGSMQLVDAKTSLKINERLNHLSKEVAAGGSAANTINGMASMGIDCGFIGKIGKDDFGDIFRKDMEKNGIKTRLYASEVDTGKATALVSPDSQRTFATYLGAAVNLSENDLEEKHFMGYQVFHVEGYLVQNHALLEKALRIAKEKGMTVSLDMASYNIVEENLEFLQQLLQKYVDIVFANEEEAMAFTGKEPREALNALGNFCEVAVVKIGEKGSLIRYKEQLTEVGIYNAQPIDTTGAGDLYAAGFLYGWVHKKPLEFCGKAGALCASKVVEVMGPKLKEHHWQEIISKLNNL